MDSPRTAIESVAKQLRHDRLKERDAFKKMQREFMAAACCFAEFDVGGTDDTPLQYWKKVTNPQSRAFYLAQADALMELVRRYPAVKA